MRRQLMLATLGLALCACTGDDEVLVPDAAPAPDAELADGGPTEVTCSCFVVGADPANGVGTAGVVHVPTLTVEQNLLATAVSSDPVVREQQGMLYVVNRFGADNIVIVDPAAGFTAIDQFSTGAGSNPQDVAVVGHKLYVVALGRPQLLVYDLNDTSQAPSTIDLPLLAADLDGNPDAASIAVVGTKAYVSLQHLESFAPAAPGSLVIVDTITDTVEGTVTLPDDNPTSLLRVDAARLLVALTPDFGDPAAGCLAAVVPGDPPTASCLAQNAAIGGLVTGFASADDGSTDLFVARGDFATGALERLAASGAVGQTLSSAGQTPGDVAACGDFVVATDNAAGGIRVWRASSGDELTSAALDIGLPPAFIGAIACLRD
jgi:hypothetical protein